MKKYEIEIDNEVYRVAVRELDADADMKKEEKTENQTNKEQTPNAPTPPPTESVAGTEIKAPMAGTIVNVKVEAGQNVTEGEVLLVLEAMKMENEIVAPADGVIGEVFVNANDSVESDQLLLTL